MATPKALNIRQAAAIERIKVAVGKIRRATGIAKVELDPQHKNDDVRQTLQLEAFADTLDAVMVAIDEMTKPPEPPPPHPEGTAERTADDLGELGRAVAPEHARPPLTSEKMKPVHDLPVKKIK